MVEDGLRVIVGIKGGFTAITAEIEFAELHIPLCTTALK
jgi:hypothetical protein